MKTHVDKPRDEHKKQTPSKSLKELEDELTPSTHKAWLLALKLLTRRPLSAQELRQKLLSHKLPVNTIQAVLKRAQDYRYLDDQELSRQLTKTAQRKRVGPLWLKRRLHARGLLTSQTTMPDDFSPTTNRASNLTKDLENPETLKDLQTLLSRRYHLELSELKQRPDIFAKACRFLRTRGFSSRFVQEVLTPPA